jgi:predicted nuclease of predicted toxin-antitoxin system
MIYWVDAQLPPQLADWLSWTFKVEAFALRDLNLRDAEDEVIFRQAQQPGIVLISKDSDFVEMVLRFGTPPQLLWVTFVTVPQLEAGCRGIYQDKFCRCG